MIMTKKLLIYLFLFLASSISSAIESNAEIERIVADFEAKPGEFNKQYKGKFLTFRGIISEISDDILEEGFYNISIDVAGSNISCRKIPKNIAIKQTEGEKVDIHGKVDDVYADDLGMIECSFLSVVKN